MKLFSRFFATNPDFSKPDSIIEHDPAPGTAEFDELMCMEPEKRLALLEFIRLVCSHLPEPEVQAICVNLEQTMTEGGDVEEVIAALLSEEPFPGLRPKFLFSAEPGRLREALEIYPIFVAALKITDALPSAVTNPADYDVAVSIAAFGEYLIKNGIEPLHLDINADTYFMCCVRTQHRARAVALASKCDLGITSNEAFRIREIDA